MLYGLGFGYMPTGAATVGGGAEKEVELYFGHMVRADNLPAFIIMSAYVDGKRARGRTRRRWMDDVEEWMGLLMADCVRTARDREGWRKLVSDPQ